MSHDDMITIHADILQLTNSAVLVKCEGEDVSDPRPCSIKKHEVDMSGNTAEPNYDIACTVCGQKPTVDIVALNGSIEHTA
ncbi:hypothetical protein, partial [Desulfovibrio sp. ZJ200]|uniref:hypothetical protein n=1 Tax=Desulfovibrio sp. ZJ200 TaxID=2709792 RepID=UPI0013EBB0DB